MDIETLAADGWTSRDAPGFTSAVGPFWRRGEGSTLEVGIIVEPRHTNSNLGALHGGALMTFADICLGLRAADAIGGSHCVTAQLQLQFVATAPVGAFVSGKPELVRQTRDMVFVRSLITTGERTVASADGIWKILNPIEN